jgi:hypothetical protein
VGNLGENSFYRATEKHPVNIYAKDFDGNGAVDAITTVFLKDEKNKLKEFSAQNRDDITSQLPGLKKRFLTYKEFGKTEFANMFTGEEHKMVLNLSANYLKSSFLRNLGNGRFELVPLPEQVQLAPVYGMVADDYNNDGYLDVALVGNDHGTEVGTGHYDALNGLVLLGNGKGSFQPQTILQSGLFVPGDAKAMVKLTNAKGDYILAASQNKGPLKVFRQKKPSYTIRLQPNDQSAVFYLRNGQKRREEFYYGNSFISQSSRFISAGDVYQKVEIMNDKGSRIVDIKNKDKALDKQKQ